MITISEVIEEAAREIEGLCDPLDSETARCAAAIRALAAQYEGCIVAEGEPYCYMERETLYRAKVRR